MLPLETLQRMREREGQAAQALVSAQLELADKCTHWNEMLVARNDAATAQHGTPRWSPMYAPPNKPRTHTRAPADYVPSVG